MDIIKKYPPKIEKLLRERGLLEKSIEEKRELHKEAMKLIETAFTLEEREGLVEAYRELREKYKLDNSL